MSDYIKKKEKKAAPTARAKAQSKLIKIDDLIEKRDGKNILIITPDMFNKDGTANFKKGGRVCKIAKRGQNRDAIGKNS